MTRAAGIEENKRLARALCTVFWHRGRRCFVPLTRDEIVQRGGVTDAAVGPALWHLMDSGMVVAKSVVLGRTRVPTYELTPLGMAATLDSEKVAA